ncbi:MAG: hypothetical protein U1F65_09115 [Verrucomicrobiota bacterium]
MKIEHIQQNNAASSLPAAKASSKAPAPAAAYEFSETDRLNQTLSTLPASRPSAVERAKALLNDPNFPSSAQLERVASQLATHWK